MADKSDAAASAGEGGVGCGTLLFVVLFALKLLGKIAWPWWKVFVVPIAISLAPLALVLLIVGVVFLLAFLIDKLFDR